MTIDEKICELDLVRNSSRLLIHQLRELAVVVGVLFIQSVFGDYIVWKPSDQSDSQVVQRGVDAPFRGV